MTLSHILLSHYCHMMYSHWTILIVTLLSHDIIALCLSRLLYALLTLCNIRPTRAVLTLCHMLLSHAVLTLCHTLLIQTTLSSYFHRKKYTSLLGSHLTKETRNKLTTFSSVASGDDPYKMYILEVEWMLAALTTLLLHTTH